VQAVILLVAVAVEVILVMAEEQGVLEAEALVLNDLEELLHLSVLALQTQVVAVEVLVQVALPQALVVLVL
jgi:hypothetical protein